MKAGNQTFLKKNNQRAIINYIIKNGPISRADLSKKMKISKPTVSTNVAELINMQLLKEIGYSETDIGKKPILVDFDRNYKYVLVLDFISYISLNKISVAICNLFCETIFIDTIELPKGYSSKNIINDVSKDLLILFYKHKIPIEKIGKLVLTAPTVWYSDKHVEFECKTGEIVNLAEVFEPLFKNKIVVENDINLAALGEKYFGVGKEVDTLFFAWIDIGIGGGIILNGKLYEGKYSNGGEIAYSTVYDEVTNTYKYFRHLTDTMGIKRYINKYVEQAKKSIISKNLLDGTFTLDMMVEACLKGDKFCSDFAKYMGKTTATVISNLASTIDLEMIIMGGEYSRFGDAFINEIKTMIKDIPTTKAVVTVPQYENSAMYGAFKFGTSQIIKNLI